MGPLWQQVARLGITIIGAVPTVLAGLKGRKVDADVSSLRWFLTGGAPLPEALAATIEAETGVAVRNILGMTECAGAIALEPVQAPRRAGSCGLRLPFTEVAVLAERDGMADPAQPLPAGETGIIALRGPHVADGYSDPARNAGTFLPGGWLVTGDLGRRDAEGRLYVTGRQKDMIIRGAHNIDPQAIEAALLAHPAVRAAAAVGLPDAYAGELPAAFVALHPGADPGEAALLAHLAERLEDPLALPKRIGVLEALPLTPVGKIYKPALRARTTRWAIEAAARRAGIAAEVSVTEAGAEITTAAESIDALEAALAGMPVAYRLRPR
jgi:fatty-acyl-CoA synthase